MGGLTKRERDGIAAVAAHFSATWEAGKRSREAWLTIAGKRIPLQIAAIREHARPGEDNRKPRLRFDKTVLQLFRHLQTALCDAVPDGRVAIVTVSAPIRLPAKTAAALEAAIRAGIARRAARVEIADRIHGNRVRIRIVKDNSRQAAKVIGFVHNPDPGADMVLLDGTEALLVCMGAASDVEAAAGRWLVIANANAFPPVEIWRRICSRLALPRQFRKIVMAFDDGRVGTLSE